MLLTYPVFLCGIAFCKYLKKEHWFLLPLVLYLIIASVLFVYDKYKIREIIHATRASDKNFIENKLEDNFTVRLPESFVKDEVYNLVKGGATTYIFTRDAYSTIGGSRRPVVLGVRFYYDSMDMNSPVDEYGHSDYFDYTGINKNTLIKIDNQILIGTFNSEETSSAIKFLYFENTQEKYRVYMKYWGNYLSDESALSIFREAVASIQK